LIILPTVISNIPNGTSLLVQSFAIILSVIGSMGWFFIPKFWILSRYKEYRKKYAVEESMQHSSPYQFADAVMNPVFFKTLPLEVLKAHHAAVTQIFNLVSTEVHRRVRDRQPSITTIATASAIVTAGFGAEGLGTDEPVDDGLAVPKPEYHSSFSNHLVTDSKLSSPVDVPSTTGTEHQEKSIPNSSSILPSESESGLQSTTSSGADQSPDQIVGQT